MRKAVKLRFLFHAYLIHILSISPAAADTPLYDPEIPDGETAQYRVEEGGKISNFIETTYIKNGARGEVYEFVYVSDTETTAVKVEKSTMIPYSIQSVDTGQKLRVTSSTEIEIFETRNYKDIVVLSFSDLKYLLRGFPFGESDILGISFLSASDEDEDDSSFSFSVDVKSKGVESVTIGSRLIECYKLELRSSASGILRVLNTLIGKTYFWFSVEPPHYLVAYEGSSGFPGSPKSLIEITDYSGWD